MEKISLEFELEDLIGQEILIEKDGEICSGKICEIRKEKYVRFHGNGETKWFKVGTFKVVDILN